METPAPTAILDDTAPDVAAKSPVQHAVEILAPIGAFFAVVILTEPMAGPIRQEIPGAIPAAVLTPYRNNEDVTRIYATAATVGTNNAVTVKASLVARIKG